MEAESRSFEGGQPLNRDLDFSRLDGEGKALFGANLQAEGDRLSDVLQTSSFVMPWLTHPGIEGHSTTQTPFSSRSMVTGNLMWVGLSSGFDPTSARNESRRISSTGPSRSRG